MLKTNRISWKGLMICLFSHEIRKPRNMVRLGGFSNLHLFDFIFKFFINSKNDGLRTRIVNSIFFVFTFYACMSVWFKFKQRKIENNLIFDKQKQNATQNNQFTSCKHSQRSNIQNSGECTPRECRHEI